MKLLLLVAAVFFATISIAQQQIFSYEPSFVEDFKSFIVPEEKTNSFYLVAVDKSFIERVHVTPAGKINMLHQGIVNDDRFRVNHRIDEKTQSLFFRNIYLNGYADGTKMIEIVQHPIFYYLFVIETDLSAGTSICTDTIKLHRRADLFFSYTHNGQLCNVEKPKGKSYFLFHRKRYGEKLTTDTLRIDLPVMGKAGNDLFEGPINGLDDITLENNMQVLPNNLWLPVHALSSRNKAFIQSDRFYITINSNDLTTWLLSVDVNNLSYRVEKYDSHFSHLEIKGQTSSASLVIDSLLIIGVSNNKKIHHSVYNINSKTLLYSQTIDEQNINKISTGPISKVGDFWSRSNVSEIQLKEFVSKSTENQLIIDGYTDKDQLYLTFGSRYKRLATATFFGNLLTLGMGGFAQVKPPSTVYFNTALQVPAFVPSGSHAKNGVWDKMLQHLFAGRTTYSTFNLFYMNDFYYIGYYNLFKNTYQLYRFYKKME